MSIDMQVAVNAFLMEGRELAHELEDGLLQLEQGHDPNDRDLINAMFRAAHTIKGSAGIVGIDSLTRFTHNVESLLDRVRSGEMHLERDMISRLLTCCDHINHLLDLAERGDMQGHGLTARSQELLDSLQAGTPATASVEQAVAQPPSASVAAQAATGQGFRLWGVFGKDCFRDGMDPASAVCYLSEKVVVTARSLVHTRIPDFSKLDPEDCWLALALEAETGSPADVRDAFEFFRDGTVVAVAARDADEATVRTALEPLKAWLPDGPPTAWLDAGLTSPEHWHSPPPAPQVIEALPTVSNVVAAPAPASRAASTAGTAAPGNPAAARFVRVPADRLDELIVQVGELVIASAGVDVLARETRHVRLQEAVEALMQLIDGIQSGALQLRMVPIGETFSRFQRVVRDVSQELGKKIQLDIVGGDTELDKAMVERIGDPLMHLVRNSMDHGLEPPAERLAAGKPEQGTLRLRAFHDSGSVVVEVSDDGRGLNRDRIVAKATERGLITSAEGLSDQDVWQLIFEPGFSTAEQVTNLSGRGVGMDVVKRSIESLRGTITLHSRPGQGTLMQMRLPLTLAILDGFMVGVGAARFIVPLDMVVECIELPADAMIADRPKYINLRGEVLPYICLREVFAIEGTPSRRPSVVVTRCGDLKTGVLVDNLHGEIQTVIKPMTGIFRHLRGISGTSILGSGDIALILDIHHMVQTTVERTARQAQTTSST
jgi:two-component system chemotaxis sensor kinase CheA